TYPRIKKEFVEAGKVRFVSRDFPLDFHPNAMRAAESARCAGEQGQFWAMHDLLGANPSKLAPEDLTGYPQNMELDAPKFDACLASGKFKEAIQSDLKEAAALQVSGTPSFVIGRTTPEGVEGVLFVGAHPFEAFEAKLKEIEAAK